MTTPSFLTNQVTLPGLSLALCINETEFMAFLKENDLPKRAWDIKLGGACTYGFMDEQAVVVGINVGPAQEDIEIARTLVHEAVHVFQMWCEYYGETAPGVEQQAYTIDYFSGILLTEFSERMCRQNQETSTSDSDVSPEST